MPTKFERVLLQCGDFGYVLKQVVDGAPPLYLVKTVHGTELIVAAGDFISTAWDGTERRKSERRPCERRVAQAPLDSSMHEWRAMERRTGERRQFVVHAD